MKGVELYRLRPADPIFHFSLLILHSPSSLTQEAPSRQAHGAQHVEEPALVQ